MIFLELFYEFFKIGLFSIGGGLATLPFLYALSDKYGWFSYNDLANMVAVSESTPGPLGVNMASYVGFIKGGFIGGAMTTIGLITPAIFIIIIISKVLDKFKDSRIVKSAFYCLRPASTALIAAAGFSVLKMSLLNLDKYGVTQNIADIFNFKAVIFAAILFVLIKYTKKHPAVYIALAAVVGIIVQL